ncbi:Bug family tripartite tricarboxylate transporter substrate binding protein [Sabulicella rubraurantiaca]|uniref:Bug family tripartite tricarboxylate transporter substrate binding protein n=1 Tax=Sabulicella rubraurantiaca TaxID=2811429 RepID=UPI001A957307|nr:tripartite tricarboxylate transporter substrate binding protein [Sabulicella rubraurantiaca]
MTTRRAALGLLATPLLLPEARAQSWPTRPLRLVVPYAPGGTTDQLGRSLAELLSRELGQPVVVENRPGGNTVIGTQAVAQAAPDGHTLLMASGASMILNPLVMRRIPYNAERDLALLSVAVETPLVMVVGPQVQARNVAEFTELAKRQPLNVATVGIGNPIHLAAELYALSAGVELQNVVYPGSAPALTSLLSGDVQVMFDVVLTSLPFIRDNRLRALAVTTRERLAVLPDVPTLAESGYPGYEASTWFGVAAPAGLPAPVEARLREALAAAQRDAGFRQRFDSLGLVVQPPRDAAAIATLLREERTRWGSVVQRRGISLE